MLIDFSESSRWLLLLAAVMLITIGGTEAYKTFAIKKGIVANPNFRSLHQRPMPSGGGIVFSLVFLSVVAFLWFEEAIDAKLASLLVFGGLVATVSGFLDDIIEMSPGKKCVIQCALAALVLFVFEGRPLVEVPYAPYPLNLGLSWLALVWLMNLYNFMDGIDGMAASGAVYICVAVAVSLIMIDGDKDVVFICALLAACSFGFLLFNRPPASIFMGDSGSLFLGYSFGALIAKTTADANISTWTWLVIFGYFAGDTTTTTVLRIFLVKRWYGAHRSNAYQNLARVWGSHRKVVSGVALYHILWLLPLTIWSVRVPSAGPVLAVLALFPVVLWTFRFGPRFSSS